MNDEKEENRIKVEDLPQQEQELTAEEAQEVKGGGDWNSDGTIVVADAPLPTPARKGRG